MAADGQRAMSRPMSAMQQRIRQQVQGAMQLQIAYVGVSGGLFDALVGGPLSAAALAERAGCDPAYVVRWSDAAYAFELLELTGADEPPRFELTELGRGFASEAAPSLLPAAVHSVLGAHMVERAAGLLQSGEQPGECVLVERSTVVPLFGSMMELTFAPIFDAHLVDDVPVFAEIDARGGLAVDLGCGNGWYLRRLCHRFEHLRGIGLDAIEENIAQASARADAEGLSDRLRFQTGDLHHFSVNEPASLIAMNRSLHHVWGERDNVFGIISKHLEPGGKAVIWEPAWPQDRRSLRQPARRGMAFQNLSEHVQGNHFLEPQQIADALEAAGLKPTIQLLCDGNEAVVVGTKPA